MVEYGADKVLEKFDFNLFFCKNPTNKAKKLKTRQLTKISDSLLLKPKQAYNPSQWDNCTAYVTTIKSLLRKNSKVNST